MKPGIAIPQPGSRPIYDRVFFCTYAANVCMLTAVSLLFRYADFVKSLGGDEFSLGLIVGIGTIGAVWFRFVQGPAIDHFGPITVWLVSLAGLAASLLLHVLIHNIDTWPVFAARTLMNLCIAGVFGSWLSFVTLRVEAHRVVEVIGVVGSSGFLGMALGPVIGDWIFSQVWPADRRVELMFLTGAAIIGVSFLFASLAGWLEWRTMGSFRQARLRRDPGNSIGMFALMKKHHPGFLLVIAGLMGLTISLPGTFLPLLAREQGFEQIKIFFLTYNAVAFVSRLSFRHAPGRLGLRNTILIGLGCMTLSAVSYNLVHSPASLVWPAIAGGLAHSFLFPAVVAGGTAFFPKENRGLATSLVMAMYDLGVLIGSPLAGLAVTVARRAGWPGYPCMFGMFAVMLIVCGIVLFRMYQRGDGSGLQRRSAAAPRQVHASGI